MLTRHLDHLSQEQKIEDLGSDKTFVDQLKTWGQDIVDHDPSFASAQGPTKAEFERITGVKGPTPSGTLAELEKEIAAYLKQRMADFAQFLADLGIPPQNVPTTVAGWQSLARLDSLQANKLTSDIALAQKTGNWQALAAKWKLPPGDDATIQKEAAARLHAYQNVMEGCGDQSAIQLFTQSLDEIRALEASGGTVADLNVWAAKINLANFPYLSDQDLKEFALLQ